MTDVLTGNTEFDTRATIEGRSFLMPDEQADAVNTSASLEMWATDSDEARTAVNELSGSMYEFSAEYWRIHKHLFPQASGVVLQSRFDDRGTLYAKDDDAVRPFTIGALTVVFDARRQEQGSFTWEEVHATQGIRKVQQHKVAPNTVITTHVEYDPQGRIQSKRSIWNSPEQTQELAHRLAVLMDGYVSNVEVGTVTKQQNEALDEVVRFMGTKDDLGEAYYNRELAQREKRYQKAGFAPLYPTEF